MTRVRLVAGDPASLKADAVIIGVGKQAHAGSSGGQALVLAAGAARIDAAMRRRLAATLQALGATGKCCEVTKVASLGATKAPTVVAVGLGDVPAGRSPRWPDETVRRATGAAIRALAGSADVAITLAEAAETDGVRAVAEGALLAGYAFTRYRHSTAGNVKSPVETAQVIVDKPKDKAAVAAVKRATVVAENVALVRDLVNTPGGDLHPADLAAAAVAACSGAGVDVEVLEEKALKKGGYGGILGVGSGSANPPRLVRLTWKGRRAKTTVHLVGKGITFDSGGLSIKPAAAMETMKCDMGGAAAVLATVRAAAQLGLDVSVVGWLAIAENMPSGSAIRPSDVLTMRGGKTVEVLNTDAEGRLVMADAIVRAGEDKPDYLLDVATLTGAQMVALGSRVFAVMGDDAVRDAVVGAADAAGEAAWPMPLPPELRPSLDSTIADIANMGERMGGMLVAGLFLKEFVAPGIPWAHLDIAGPAYNEGDEFGYTPKGGTGVPVRTLLEWLETLTPSS